MSFTSKSTGGEYTHTLTSSELAEHTHTEFAMVEGYSEWSSYTPLQYSIVFNWHGGEYRGTTDKLKAARCYMNVETGVGGKGKSHNNISPYFTVYFWQRII